MEAPVSEWKDWEVAALVFGFMFGGFLLGVGVMIGRCHV